MLSARRWPPAFANGNNRSVVPSHVPHSKFPRPHIYFDKNFQDPFSSQRLEASLSSFIGQDDEDGHLSPEREAIINVLEAYENFWENGPARGATNAKIRKIGAAKLPFPHLTPQAAAQKILEKAAEVQASSQYE